MDVFSEYFLSYYLHLAIFLEPVCWKKRQKQLHDQLKFGYSEKATKFEKIFHLKFDVTECEECQNLSGRFFRILWPSQNIPIL